MSDYNEYNDNGFGGESGFAGVTAPKSENSLGATPNQTGSVNASQVTVGNHSGQYREFNPQNSTLEKIGEAAKNYTVGAYENTASVQGVRETQSKLRLVGIGNGGGTYSKAQAASAELEKRLSKLGYSTSGNAASDFAKIQSSLEKDFKKVGLDAKSLKKVTVEEINKQIKAGNGISLKGDKFKIDRFDSNYNKFVSDFQKYSELSELKQLSKIAGQGGKKFATTREWGDQLYGDTEVAQGYKTTSKVFNVAKTTGKAGVGAAKVTAHAGNVVSTKVATSVIDSKVNKAQTEVMTKLGNGDIKGAGNEIGKINDLNAFKASMVDRGGLAKAAGNKVATKTVKMLEKTGVGRGVVNGGRKIGNFIGKNARAVKLVRKKVLDAKLALRRLNPLLALKNKFNVFKRKAKIVALVLAGVFLLIVGVIIPGMGQAALSFIEASDDKSKNVKSDGTELDSTLEIGDSRIQETINNIWDIHYGYMVNITHCKKGSYYYPHGIPDTWILSDEAMPGDTTLSELAAVYDDSGKLMGYNLEHYWGPRDQNISRTVYHAYVEHSTHMEPVYDDYGNWLYDEEVEDYGYPKTHILSLNIHLNRFMAGLRGDLGEYIDPTDYGDGAFDSNFDVHDDCAAFDEIKNDENINKEIEVKFHYMGSEYSYLYTPNKVSSYKTYMQGTEVDYDLETLYKAFTCAVISFTKNDINESSEFYFDYCKTLFDNAMNASKVSLKAGPVIPDPERIVPFRFTGYHNGQQFSYDIETATGYTRRITVDIILDQQGLADLIHLDSCDTSWIAAHNPQGEYKDHLMWDGWFKEDGTPNYAYENALSYYDTENGEFQMMMENLVLPVGFFATPFEGADEIIPYNFYYGFINEGSNASTWLGRTTSAWGARIHPVTGEASFHAGLDISLVAGTALPALGDGRVVAVGYQAGGAGYYLKYELDSGEQINYYHLNSAPSLVPGERVTKGQQVAVSGNTGRSTGAHLHLEVHVPGAYDSNGGNTVDPVPWLESLGPVEVIP